MSRNGKILSDGVFVVSLKEHAKLVSSKLPEVTITPIVRPTQNHDDFVISIDFSAETIKRLPLSTESEVQSFFGGLTFPPDIHSVEVSPMILAWADNHYKTDISFKFLHSEIKTLTVPDLYNLITGLGNELQNLVTSLDKKPIYH